MTPFGFRIVGDCTGERRLIDWAAAFRAHAACDPKAELDRECYISAFTFGADFKQQLQATGSTRGYSGSCAADWLWFDIDHPEDLERGRREVARLALKVIERFGLDDAELLLFFSGSKGFHAGLPTAGWMPEPSENFHRVAGRFAENLATLATVTIDRSIYDRVRAFRAPNSFHPKTGLHKSRLSLKELMYFPVEKVLDRAKRPEPFDVPNVKTKSQTAAADWAAAEQAIEAETAAHADRRAQAHGAPRLNRLTLDFIRDGAQTGDRHRLLYSAARNLAEFGCPAALAHSLLTEPALDSGLPPSDVRRQIDCGLKDHE